MVHFGDRVMIHNKKTKSFLAVNIYEKTLDLAEGYVTVATPDSKPVIRQIFVIQKYSSCPHSSYSTPALYYS